MPKRINKSANKPKKVKAIKNTPKKASKKAKKIMKMDY